MEVIRDCGDAVQTVCQVGFIPRSCGRWLCWFIKVWMKGSSSQVKCPNIVQITVMLGKSIN